MKKIIKITLMISTLILLTGCLKRDNLEDITIYTTVYPLEYITKRLYNEHSEIKSIYPDGVNIDNYNLTEKQIKDYSKGKLFIFNALSPERDYVIPLFNYNKNIKIIDSSLSMTYDYSVEELWLNPSNFLMLAQNIRIGFKEYIQNHYLKKEIDENYEQLYIEISNLDASLKQLSESATTNILIVSNNVFKFLEKYNFEVISLEETDQLTDKTIAEVEKLIEEGTIKYIFIKQHEEINDVIKNLIAETNVQTETLHSITNLNDEERTNDFDYITLMNDNIEKLKNELYN